MRSKLTSDERGNKKWRLPDGDLHRKDGPAVEYSNGNKYWYINGAHREDGPALEYASGTKHWCLNGKQYTEQEHKQKMRSIKLKLLL